MATYLDLINEVLVLMREDEVATLNQTSYSKLVGRFVNQAKREVEDAHKWNVLRTQIQVTTAAGSNNYVLMGAGKRWKLQDPLFSVYDATNKNFVKKVNSQWAKRQLLQGTDTGFPCFWYTEGQDASENPRVYFVSEPSGVYTINFELVVPQNDFTADGDIISIPHEAVVLGAYARALDERGEDQGQSYQKAVSEYQLAANDAIAIDSSKQVGEDEWTVQ